MLTAVLEAPALILLLSPTLRQSGELFRDKVLPLFRALPREVGATRRETALTLELANGSRILSLPGEEGTTRGYSGVALLIVDEAARVPDALYYAIRPMLAVSGGALVCLSSAYARQGFFFDAWTQGGPEWERIQIMATECPRIDAAFLAEERLALGERIFKREYGCVFSAADDAVFAPEAIDAALAALASAPPLF